MNESQGSISLNNKGYHLDNLIRGLKFIKKQFSYGVPVHVIITNDNKQYHIKRIGFNLIARHLIIDIGSEE